MKKLFSWNLSLSFGLIWALAVLMIQYAHQYIALHLSLSRVNHIYLIILSVIAFFIAGAWVGKLLYKLQYMAMEDYLTHLWNKRYFDIKLTEAINRQKRLGESFCVALVDIDDFKQVNDRLGHPAGDLALVNIADIFKRNTRNIDVVTRWGGDEFAIIFPDTRLDECITVSNRLREAVSKNNECYQLTISIGIEAVDGECDQERIFKEVDEMLLRAKQVKNAVVTSFAGAAV